MADLGDLTAEERTLDQIDAALDAGLGDLIDELIASPCDRAAGGSDGPRGRLIRIRDRAGLAVTVRPLGGLTTFRRNLRSCKSGTSAPRKDVTLAHPCGYRA